MLSHSRRARSISNAFRMRRFQRFLLILNVKPSVTILDVGGLPQTWEGTGFEENVTILNINFPKNCPQPFRWIKGDACEMYMFDDRSFDIVFSNSVIEHIGDISRQRQMAKEIRRVGRKYWLQTPYKHFPIEVHFLFPFYQYFPHDLRITISKRWPLSYAKILNLDPIYEAEHIWLLDYKELQSLFPDACILSEKFIGLTKSLIAVKV